MFRILVTALMLTFASSGIAFAEEHKDEHKHKHSGEHHEHEHHEHEKKAE